MSNVLNSFGFVPRVAGKLQQEGRSSAARQDRLPIRPTLVLDIASCYRVKELKELQQRSLLPR